jgi:hypothetical protein
MAKKLLFENGRGDYYRANLNAPKYSISIFLG